jgi:hypothetical protein
VLALGFNSTASLEELTGASPRGMPCCASAAVVSGGDRAHPRRSSTALVSGLTGTTDGQLVPLVGGQLLAAIATQRGVWIAESTVAGRFDRARRLSFGGAPTDLAAAALAGGGGVVAWTSASGGYGAGARRILFAAGSAKAPPSVARVAVTVPPGHTIDELALAPGARGPALAWVESWTDRRGASHSVVEVRDLESGAASARIVSPRFELATDVAFAGDGAGDQVLAFDGCSPTGVCVARAAVRRPRRAFGPPQRLGPIDASQAVTATVTGSGDTLVAWISSGHVVAALQGIGARRFGRPKTVSQTDYAADLALAPGPGRTAFAAWTQGTLAPIVVGAAFRG